MLDGKTERQIFTSLCSTMRVVWIDVVLSRVFERPVSGADIVITRIDLCVVDAREDDVPIDLDDKPVPRADHDCRLHSHVSP